MLNVNWIMKLLRRRKRQGDQFTIPISFLISHASDFHFHDLDTRSDWVLRRGPDYKDGRETWVCWSQAREEYLTKDGHSCVFTAKSGWGNENPIENPNSAFVFTSLDATIEALLLYFWQHPDAELERAFIREGWL